MCFLCIMFSSCCKCSMFVALEEMPFARLVVALHLYSPHHHYYYIHTYIPVLPCHPPPPFSHILPSSCPSPTLPSPLLPSPPLTQVQESANALGSWWFSALQVRRDDLCFDPGCLSDSGYNTSLIIEVIYVAK